MKTDSEILELAEKHWRYSKGLIEASGAPASEREHYLYVQAAIHFYKHGVEDTLKEKDKIK